MRVLLVDDNKDQLATLAALLRFEKYEVIAVDDSQVALEMAKLEPPDVALLDIGLPGMDGYKLAQALRKQLPDRKLFIAAITGYASPADKARCSASGIDAHLAKPAPPTAVLQLLKQFAAKL